MMLESRMAQSANRKVGWLAWNASNSQRGEKMSLLPFDVVGTALRRACSHVLFHVGRGFGEDHLGH